MTHLGILILQEVYNMLWYAHIQACFDLVWASRLENWSDNR